MIEIACKKTKFTYNVYHITKAFFPDEEIVQKVDEKQESLVELKLPGGSCFSLAPEDIAGEPVQDIGGRTGVQAPVDENKAQDAARLHGSEEDAAQAEKRAVTRRVYRFLCEESGRELAWGTLTGVRPTKLQMQMLEEGKTRAEITRFIEKEYFVTPAKAELGYEIACREKALLEKLDCRGGFSLYAGIPFCPSVCSYCSFSSSPIGVWKDRVDSYLDALVRELRAIGRMAQGRYPDTVYIGGGTPTTLEPDQLRRLLTVITENFDLSHTVEFTVDDGRPDSIT